MCKVMTIEVGGNLLQLCIVVVCFSIALNDVETLFFIHSEDHSLLSTFIQTASVSDSAGDRKSKSLCVYK